VQLDFEVILVDDSGVVEPNLSVRESEDPRVVRSVFDVSQNARPTFRLSEEWRTYATVQERVIKGYTRVPVGHF
jgi:hypothetical protein